MEADPSGGAALLTCRIVSGAGAGELLLAEQGEGFYNGTGVYTLSVGQIPVLLDGASASAEDLEDGMLVEISCSGMVEETFPARLGGVTALSAASGADGGFDNLCTLYLQVLEDLWEVDSGLNQGITGRQRFKFVRRGNKRCTGNDCQFICYATRIFRMGI